MAKTEKTEALRKKLANVIMCKKCGSKKHSSKEHDPGATKEDHEHDTDERANKEVEKDEEEE